MQWAKQKQSGFTIVEMAVVVVMIVIIASIAVLAYRNLPDSSREARVVNELAQVAKKLEANKSLSSNVKYPATLAAADISTTGSTFEYTVSSLGKGYCLVAKDDKVTYSTTQANSAPVKGSCGSADGLVGWWPMNDLDNGGTTDYSGNRSTGVLKGGVIQTAGVNNAPRTAFDFNGSNGQILCGDNEILRPTDAVTITAWIRPRVVSGSLSGIVNYGAGGYWLSISSSANLTLYISTTNLGNTARPIVADQWQFVVGRYQGGTGKMGVYTLNGGGVWSTGTTYPTTITNYPASGEACQIGSIKSVASRWFNGAIDDVRIYNKNLSDDEVQKLYAAGAY